MKKSFDDIVTHLEAVTQRPYLIAIDGRSCSGKSVLATKLQHELPELVVVHVDDFYRVMDESARAALDPAQGYYQYSDWQRLAQQVLVPLSAGEPGRYQRYDWPQHALAEFIDVGPQPLVVIEGVASTRPELRAYYHFRIWVETSAAAREQRQLARPWDSPEWIYRWSAAETYYVENFEPQLSAHAILPGE